MALSSVHLERHLHAARAGSRDSLGQALQSFRHYLLEIARVELDPVLRAKGGASDLVQETFLEASQAFSHFHGASRAELRAWLRCLLLHHVAKHGRRFRTTRKRGIDREIALDAASAGAGTLPARQETPSQAVVADEEMERLQAALARLPADYRDIVRLRYQEGRSFEEIAVHIGRTANAARLLWLRAVERVKHELKRGPDG